MSDELVGKVYIIQPYDEEGEPIELYFAVTEDGLLLHLEKMDPDIPKEIVSSEIAKLLGGLDSARGRYNEFVKNSGKYQIKMAVVPPITIYDARKIDEKYRMSKEERIRAIEKEKELWMR